MLMFMFVQLLLIGSQAFMGRPASTISTIQAVVESWQAGKILHVSYEDIKSSLESMNWTRGNWT